jgi:hypothetical protein
MTQNDLANVLYEMTKRYFGGAKVVWNESKKVKPTGNLVTLRLGSVSRNLFPLADPQRDGVTSYHATTVFEVKLFTKGKSAGASTGVSAPRVNTALNDLLDFMNYAGSQLNTDWLSDRDVCLLPKGDARNLTALINGNNWEYKAMTEFDVTYVQSMAGGYAIGPEPGDAPWEVTASGGGSAEMSGAGTGYYERVEVEETE